MNKIVEHSLRPGILKDLIYPIVSVDEYTPKIGDDNIVICFQVLDNFDAAYDLSSFIEKCPFSVLDTEAAENPNIDGRYMVFVEVERNGEFPELLLSLLKIIENLYPEIEWKLQLYGVNDPIDVDFDEITKRIELSSTEQLDEFFNYGNISTEILDSTIVLKTAYGDLHYELGSGIVSESFVKKQLAKSTELDTTRLSHILGENYNVLKSGNQYIVGYQDKYIILR